MQLAVRALLADPSHFPAWKDRPPVVFTTRATAPFRIYAITATGNERGSETIPITRPG